MMTANILITGASGYLGGSLLSQVSNSSLVDKHNIYALVRTQSQAEAVKQYGAQPLTFSPHDEVAVKEAISEHEINVVYFLIDAMQSKSQVCFIKALAELKGKTGQVVHFLHTSGAKLFSSHAGAPTDRPLLDTDSNLYDVQKSQKSRYAVMQGAVTTNNTIIEMCESMGVRSYIFVPCVVYGRGMGFGNKTSIQTVAIVKAAKGAKRVYKVDDGRPSWPVSHIYDTTALYARILESIINDDSTPYGKQGYYLASSGNIAWEDIYAKIAGPLWKKGIVEDERVGMADSSALETMGKALGCPGEFVGVQLGGNCTFTANRGSQIDWKPKYNAEHILESMDEEVTLILDQLKDLSRI